MNLEWLELEAAVVPILDREKLSVQGKFLEGF